MTFATELESINDDGPKWGKPVYTPTPEQIADGCARIRAEWSEYERVSRCVARPVDFAEWSQQSAALAVARDVPTMGRFFRHRTPSRNSQGK